LRTIPIFCPRSVSRVSLPLVAILMTLSVSIAPCEAFTFFENFKWAPGLNSAEEYSGDEFDPPMSPGGASWSAVPSGVEFADVIKNFVGHPELRDHPVGAVSTDIEFLITPEVDGLEYSVFNEAYNVWAAASGMSNLGQVADSGANIGDTEANNGHIGDIRVAGMSFAGFAAGDLAHGFPPCTFDTCDKPEDLDGTLGGAIHFNTIYSWVDDPNEPNAGDFDFFTVALHEIGHALGLFHSNVPGSVMQAAYVGARRELQPDDIDGIQALYGLPEIVPEPSSLVLALFGLTGLLGRRRGTRHRYK